MKVLLINPPGWQKGSINLGLSYLGAALLADRHEVKIFDVNAGELSPEAVAEKAKKYAPDIIGFSVKTATVRPALLISSAIKKTYKEAVHVAGGPHITLMYEEFLKEGAEFEYAFLGESDESFPLFINKLEKKEEFSSVPGLVYKKAGKLIATERKLAADLDKIPFPNFDSIDTFVAEDFRYPLITSRGCPYLCIYCCVGIVSSKKWRGRSVANIISELEYAKEHHGIKTFEILDDNFTLKLDRAKEFCRALIKRKLNLSWYCHNGIRADKLDLELTKLMKKAGCTSIALGIESGDEKVFNSIKKGEKLSDIVAGVRLIQKAGMRAVGYFIIGLPGDTAVSVANTIRFMKGLRLDNYMFGILTPYPGTEAYETVKKDGKILLDIRDTYHFSENIKSPIEYPNFTSTEIEEAYYNATYHGLYSARADFKQKTGRLPEKILYINFTSDTGFFSVFSRVFEMTPLDLFTSQYRTDPVLENRKKYGLKEVFVYIDKFSRFKQAAEFFKFALAFRKKKYDIIFYNGATRRLFIPAAIILPAAKYFYIESEQGKYIKHPVNREHLKLLLSKLNPLKLLGFTAALLFYIVMRAAALIFAAALFFKRTGKKLVFGKEAPGLEDVKSK